MAVERASRRTDRNLRDAMFKKHNGICQKCGILTNFDDYTVLYGQDNCRTLGPTFPTLEHIKPRCFGGESHEENVTLFCNRCNNRGSVSVQRKQMYR